MKKVLSILLAVVLVFGMLPASALTVFAADSYEKATSIAVGDTVVFVCESKGMEMSTIGSKTYGEGKAYSDAPTGLVPLTVVAGSGAAYAFQTSDGKYLYWTSGNSLNVNDTLNSNTSWNVSFDASGNAVIANGKDSARKIQWNANSPRFAAYTSTQTAIQLYKLVTGSTDPDVPACEHLNTQILPAEEPDCNNTGLTEGEVCLDCGETITEQEEVPANGHSYVDGVCEVCGEEKPSGGTATISFANTDQRDSLTTSSQVWKDDINNTIITFTNNKASSTTNVADYSNPIRLYKSSEIVVSCATGYVITSITFVANSSSYATAMNTSIGTVSGATVAVSGSNVTVDFDSAVESFTVASLSAQIRLNSLSVDFVAAGGSAEPCTHANTEPIAAVPATCIATGLTEGSKCSDCGEILTAQEPTPLADHAYAEGACSVCGKVDPSVETKAELMTTLPGNGDKIIVYYPVDKKAMGTSNAVSTEPVDTLLPYNTAVAVLTVELDGENYALKLSDGTYLATGATGGDLTFLTEVSELAQWTVETAGNNLWYITNVGAAYNSSKQALEYYGGAFKTWTKGEGAEFQMSLYLVEKGENACQHANTQEQSDGYAAKCGVPGMTNSIKCLDCGITTKSQEEIPALEHNYVDYVCTLCGDEQKIGNYVRVGDIAEITDGQYVIVAEVDGKYYALDTKTSGKFAAVEVTVSDNTVTTTEAPIWTVATVNGNITLQTGESYLGWKSSTDFSAVDNYEWVVAAADNNTNTFNFTASTTVSESTNRGIFYRTGTTNKYGAYATTNSSQTDEYYWDLQLYKYVQPVAAYKDGAWVGYNTVEKALENSNQIKLYAAVDGIAYDGDLYLDVNGFAATNVTATKIYAYDSTATSAAAGTGSITTSSEVVMDNTVNEVRYIALENDGTYTFHVLEMKLSAVTLRANEECGIYYKATYACDDTLKNAIDSYGVVFSLQDMPGADFKTETGGRNLYTVYEKDSFVSGAEVTSGSIFGIMKKGLTDNAERGKMDIHANAYIVINGETLVGTGKSYSLFTVMKAMDDNWAKYEAAGKTDAIKAFYEMWKDEGMSAWADEFENIA